MHAPHLTTIAVLAVSSNLDNIGVGVSYGIRRVNIPLASNILIALITSCGTLASILFGRALYHFLSPQVAAPLGGGVIIAAGFWVIFQEIAMKRGKEPHDERPDTPENRLSPLGLGRALKILENPLIADSDFSGHIDLGEATVLAVGLTLNNIPNGVGAGMLGLNAVLTTSAVFLASIVTIWLGISCGHLGFRRLGKSVGSISGFLLILIGVYEILS